MHLLIGTDDGLYELGQGAPRRLRAGKVTHLAAGRGGAWAIVDDRIESLAEGSWEPPPRPEGSGEPPSLPAGLQPRCLLPMDGSLLIGTSEAHLYRAEAAELVPIDGFAGAAGRDEWHTPWGGPPDTRSLARDAGGSIYANVHVGGVLRSADSEGWEPTMDIGADVHQVNAHPTLAACVLVASARGLGLSFDGATSWEFTRDGLHSAYARAVAAADETLYISASAGPSGGRAALYRRTLRGSTRLERCRSGLPEWFEGNIDTGCLVASGAEVALGTAGGEVHASRDAGATWSQAASDLPSIRALAVVALSTRTG